MSIVIKRQGKTGWRFKVSRYTYNESRGRTDSESLGTVSTDNESSVSDIISKLSDIERVEFDGQWSAIRESAKKDRLSDAVERLKTLCAETVEAVRLGVVSGESASEAISALDRARKALKAVKQTVKTPVTSPVVRRIVSPIREPWDHAGE
ncbi:hypothetical protein [Acetobacter fabarum]|uniref:Uncharacterized protein n=1 Tax=Acetobacter fabarum TaxID=483199 RepID=A0A269XTZ4_9PROT|nr:hypothetical protein [Acetobacter fabarum]PAK76783.1 hypothetical protein B8X00_13080 [Acetobacter fabarum]PEN21923.1 hypothetical protein CRM93_13615 [Acetobacter fabarum]